LRRARRGAGYFRAAAHVELRPAALLFIVRLAAVWDDVIPYRYYYVNGTSAPRPRVLSVPRGTISYSAIIFMPPLDTSCRFMILSHTRTAMRD
jgi:hypothetical protein